MAEQEGGTDSMKNLGGARLVGYGAIDKTGENSSLHFETAAGQIRIEMTNPDIVQLHAILSHVLYRRVAPEQMETGYAMRLLREFGEENLRAALCLDCDRL